MNSMETKRLEYPLDEKSIVFDIGGYMGTWSYNMYEKYTCRIYIFEPIKIFHDIIKQKFIDNSNIKVFNIALGSETKECDLYKNADRTSLHITTGIKEIIKMVSFSEFIKNNPVENIDVMKINIEGEEYKLLDNIIDNDLHLKISNIQIQFHNFIHDSVSKRNKILKKLEVTHEITFNYDFVWENWRKK